MSRGTADESFMRIAEEVGRVAKTSPDDQLIVAFDRRPERDELASREAGRPIFAEVDYIIIRAPGDKDNIIERPVDEMDARRFATRYLEWKKTGENREPGTPLAMWPEMSRAQVEELAFFKVTTVEQLANLSDANCQKWPGIQALKQKARDFIEAASGNAPMVKMRAELEELKATNETLRQAVEELRSALAKRSK